MTTPGDATWPARWDHCYEDMGSDPCGLKPVTTRLDPETREPYPVCRKHDRPSPGDATGSAPVCPHGDPACPCPDDLQCHYEGKDPWPPPVAGSPEDRDELRDAMDGVHDWLSDVLCGPTCNRSCNGKAQDILDRIADAVLPVVQARLDRAATQHAEQVAAAGVRGEERVSKAWEHWITEARAERDTLRATVERVRTLHRRFGIYSECGHDHAETDPGVIDVQEVGYVCEEGRVYDVCRECCTVDGNQREEYADYHQRPRWPCATIRVLGPPTTAGDATCSTCGGPMDSPPCCVGPNGGSHTVEGGCAVNPEAPR